jgi:glycosyltransferase involved in cell wall biosynthesis
MPLKILVVHNRYQSTAPSGEDAVVEQELQLLLASGHEVTVYERSNDELSDSSSLLRAGVQTVWSRRTYRELQQLIARERPAVAHFHNSWYVVSPSAYLACRDAGIPVVQTLHNYRLFCLNGLLLREGRVCEDCVGHLPWRGVVRGCYRTRAHSLPVAAAQIVHRLGPLRWVDAFIALSAFSRDRLIASGLPPDRIWVKPNFFAGRPGTSSADAGYGMYLGRLTAEKGLDTLLEAVRRSKDIPFRIVGDGSLRASLERRCRDLGLAHVVFMGALPREECLRVLANAAFLVVPSLCYENFPMALVEAYALGKPVVASRLGALAELVEDGVTGLLFSPGNADELEARLRTLADAPLLRQALGATARLRCAEHFGPQRNLELLEAIYRAVRPVPTLQPQ